MAGLYIHIPFCKKACHYCNFHFSTSLRLKEDVLEALCTEIALQHNYLGETTLASIYLGGGTPSLLDGKELERLFATIHRHFKINDDAEITLEANPDDLAPKKLMELKAYTPVNRLSIGVQSFGEADLQWMNRAHTAAESLQCLEHSLAAGFRDLTVDLIYGSPLTSDEQWAANLRQVFDLSIPHLSCYCLTVEEGTALAHFVRKGKAKPVDEEQARRQFEVLMEAAAAQGYIHYEISNFAMEGHMAVHNSNYWKGEPYLGIGPSAHSFRNRERQWNVANNAAYVRSIRDGVVPFEREYLTSDQAYNEYVMTRMRTLWGCSAGDLLRFGDRYWVNFQKNVALFVESGDVETDGAVFRLTKKGRHWADHIAASLFI